MKLDDLVLHPRTQQLTKKFASKLPQGLIIDGPVGSGVSTLALAIANHVGSPDFVILPKKRKNGEYVINPIEGNVIIDDIRQLYKQTQTAQPGKHVYVIDTGLKSMTISAQNAFLKLLEEPRDGLHFIISTHQFEQLLPTIVSRCQRLSVLPITNEQTTDFLDRFTIDDQTKKARLAFVGRGRPALLQYLIDNPDAYEKRVKIMSDAKILLGVDTYEKIHTIQLYKDSRADAITLLDDMNYQLQTIIKKHPNKELARTIDKNLSTRDHISAGGNVRLQLLSNVL
ncbi:AAA family ATPase [Candidatus Saccharibacteria bacterium]|nr:AAA family ATPase [Candidatus Saccharibacteria bacterium]